VRYYRAPDVIPSSDSMLESPQLRELYESVTYGHGSYRGQPLCTHGLINERNPQTRQPGKSSLLWY
jgi:hypothetical protein